MEVKEEFEPAPEEMEGVEGPDVGRTECFFPFALSFCFSFGGEGRKELGILTRTAGFCGCVFFACNLAFYIPLRVMAMVAAPLLP